MNSGGLQSEVCVQGGSRVEVAFQQQEHLVNLAKQQGRGHFLQGLPESARHSTVKHHGLRGLNGNLFLVVAGAAGCGPGAWESLSPRPFSLADKWPAITSSTQGQPCLCGHTPCVSGLQISSPKDLDQTRVVLHSGDLM